MSSARDNDKPTINFDEDEDYVPYVPVHQRRQAKLAKFAVSSTSATKRKHEEAEAVDEAQQAADEEELRREKARKDRTLLLEAQEVQKRKAVQGAWRTRCACVQVHCGSRADELRCAENRCGTQGGRGGRDPRRHCEPQATRVRP